MDSEHLSAFDVQQLKGVGPRYAAKWTELLQTPAIQSMISVQRQPETTEGT